MSDDLSKVDWGKPIEAWNPITNKTVPMRLETGAGGGLVTEDCPDPSTSNTWWRQDGTNRCVGSPWRIRNVAEAADHANGGYDPDCAACRSGGDAITLTADQAAMLRKVLTAIGGCVETTIGHQTFFVPAQVMQDARDALALLPEPVDADEQWAIEQVAAHGYSDRRRPDQRTLVEIMTACVQHGRTRALERDSREG